MAIQTYPPTAGTVNIVHSGPVDGEAFSGPFSGADGAPVAPRSSFTWTLATHAPDLENLYPVVIVYGPDNKRVEADTIVTSSDITVSFASPVEPSNYRIKVIG